ncbi:major facilitator superfamily domain-containing protein [Chaetomium sp. MPI-SDFR-AT-0129]|nr:major facilitator superfamily domain-containing protein [Chaetomium sp. MPI-SDFR-AT-0129]
MALTSSSSSELPSDESTCIAITMPSSPVAIIVSWEEPENEDPANPLNWSALVKWANILTLSVISFLVPLVSSMIAPAVPRIMQDFQTTSPLFATFSVSIFVLGFASGPLLLAPLSELYGRVIIYNTTNVLFLLFTLLCSVAPNEQTFLAFRFLSGFVGVATITIGSGTIADLMPKEERGRAVSVWSVGTILGPMVGPIIGGYVSEVAGWKWVFWGVAIVIALATIAAFFILRETYPPILLARKAAKLNRLNRNKHTDSNSTPPIYVSKLALTSKTTSPKDLFTQAILRPTTLLLTRPAVTILCTYVAVLYGTLYLLFATYAFVFPAIYDFSPSAAGLVFLPGGAGTLLGLAYTARFSDRNIKKVKKGQLQDGQQARMITPEDRLPLIITVPGALAFPLGLFVYGWTAEYGVHWAVPLLGTAITGFGSILVFVGVQTYLIDAFEGHAASAVGANAVLRGLAGALLPLGGLGLYESLGWGWGNGLLGFLALGLAPVPVLFGRYGAWIRGWRVWGWEGKDG